MSADLRSSVRALLLDLDDMLASRAHVVAHHGDESVDVVIVDSASAVLHSFYSGIERAFYLIAKVEGGVAWAASRNSPTWHRELLDFVSSPPPTGCGVIDSNLRSRLEDFRGFRHVFRGSAPHRIEWNKVRLLLANLPSTYADTREAIEIYLEKRFPAR